MSVAKAARSLISIHAAREGGDAEDKGAHLRGSISIHAAREGGDLCVNPEPCCFVISIHAAREGGDMAKGFRLSVGNNFNPRRP